MASETTLKTVDRAMRVLEIVAASPSPPLTRDVADALGHNLTSTYHLVNTLIASGYLEKAANGRLAIGKGIAVLHESYVRSSDFAESARSVIASLASATEETIYLTRFDPEAGASAIEIVVESTRSLRVTGLRVGYSGMEDQRASGKAVLAYLRPDQLDAIVARLHPELGRTTRAAELAALSDQLAEVRLHGYAFDDEDFEEGVCCVAAPYFGPGGRIAGAIAASCPALRRERLLTEVRSKVIEAAERVTEFASLGG
jgi:IclR family acetate operon transcriptional repressor